jgi:hypothetical protein
MDETSWFCYFQHGLHKKKTQCQKDKEGQNPKNSYQVIEKWIENIRLAVFHLLLDQNKPYDF